MTQKLTKIPAIVPKKSVYSSTAPKFETDRPIVSIRDLQKSQSQKFQPSQLVGSQSQLNSHMNESGKHKQKNSFGKKNGKNLQMYYCESISIRPNKQACKSVKPISVQFQDEQKFDIQSEDMWFPPNKRKRLFSPKLSKTQWPPKQRQLMQSKTSYLKKSRITLSKDLANPPTKSSILGVDEFHITFQGEQLIKSCCI